MFTPLQALLPRAARKHDMHRQITAAHICQKYRQIASVILSDEVALKTAPSFYKDKILVINVADSAVAQEVFLHKTELLEAINRALGSSQLTDLRTHLVPFS